MSSAEPHDPESRDVVDDELLSAYLDGELTDAQRAEVDRRLASDDAAQRLVDELRSLSSTLQKLPTEAPSRELLERVLAQLVERDVTRPPTAPPRHNRRGFAWAAAAIAAALLLAIYVPRDQGEEDVSLAGADKAKLEDAALEKARRTRNVPELRAIEPDGEVDKLAADDAPAPSVELHDEIVATAEPMNESTPAEASARPEPSSPLGGLRSRGTLFGEKPTRQNAAKSESAVVQRAEADLAQAASRSRLALSGTPQSLPMVEITLAGDGAKLGDFQQLLLENDIDLRVAAKPAREKQDSSASRHAQPPLDEKAMIVEEALLVEAYPDQFERVLATAHQNDKTYASLDIIPAPAPLSNDSSGPRQQQATREQQEQWRVQYSRIAEREGLGSGQGGYGAYFDQSNRREAYGREAAGDAEAIETKGGELQPKSRKTLIKKSVQRRGWAVQLDEDAANQLRQYRHVTSFEPQKQSAQPDHDGRVQVLFLLRKAEDP